MITIIQILFIVFAVFAWSRAFLRLKDKEIGMGEFIFWSCIWVAVISLAIYPRILTQVSQLLGIERGTDTVIYVGVVVLFYLMFRLYVKVDGLSREITKVVREVAIRDSKKKK